MRSRRWTLWFGDLILSLLLLAPAAAALAAAQPSRTDSLFRAGVAEGSHASALADVALLPNDYETLWRAARAETVRGVVAGGTDKDKSAIFLKGETFARRATALKPNRVEGHYWLAAALGRRTWVESMLSAARLGAEARRETLRVLAIDSLNAGGHGLLGKMYLETAELGFFPRMLASTIMGGPVSRSVSQARAEQELTRAIALDPEVIVHRADLALLYLRTNRLAVAERVVEELVSLPARTPADPQIQRSILGVLAAYRARH